MSRISYKHLTIYGVMDGSEYDQISKNHKWPQFLTTLCTVIVSFCAGIHYGWPTPSLPQLLSNDSSLNVTSVEGSYVIAIASVGDIVGNIVFTILADKIGRKFTILLISTPQIFSMLLLNFSSYSLSSLFLARFLGGIAEGASLSVLPIYIAEISEPEIRGILMSFFSITWTSGCLFINILGSYSTIQKTSLITLIFPLIFLITFVFVPESPYYHLMKNQIKQARQCLKKLRWNNDVEEELGELINAVRRQMSEPGKYEDLFLNKTNRRGIFLMVAVTAVCEFSGISSLSFYAQLFFTKAINFLPGRWAASLIIFIQLICSVISSFGVDYVGRRPLLLFSIGGCGSSLTLLSIYFFINDYSLDISEFNWIPLAAFILFVAFFNLGIANIVNCLGGELFSASIKTKAACFTAIVYSIFVIIVTKIYQTLSDNYSLGVPVTIFAIAQLFGFVFCWRYVPETRGKSLEEIQLEIKGNVKKKNHDPCCKPLLNAL